MDSRSDLHHFDKLSQKERDSIQSIWQIGCHRGQEMEYLCTTFKGLKKLLLIDPLINMTPPDTKIAWAQKNYPSIQIDKLQAAICGYNRLVKSEGVADFYVSANDGMSSSILHMKEHLIHFPGVAEASVIQVNLLTLEKLMEMYGYAPDCLIMDIQGMEGEVLESDFTSTNKIKYIYAEVSFTELYLGQMIYSNLVDILVEDYRLVGVQNDHETYGNALWQRRG